MQPYHYMEHIIITLSIPCTSQRPTTVRVTIKYFFGLRICFILPDDLPISFCNPTKWSPLYFEFVIQFLHLCSFSYPSSISSRHSFFVALHLRCLNLYFFVSCRSLCPMSIQKALICHSIMEFHHSSLCTLFSNVLYIVPVIRLSGLQIFPIFSTITNSSLKTQYILKY